MEASQDSSIGDWYCFLCSIGTFNHHLNLSRDRCNSSDRCDVFDLCALSARQGEVSTALYPARSPKSETATSTVIEFITCERQHR
jgi:hypothetical protein